MGFYCRKRLLLVVVCMAASCQAGDVLNETLTVNNTSNGVLNASALPVDPLIIGDTASKCREDDVAGQGRDSDNCTGVNTQRILSSPVGCPVGYAADTEGMCRELWNSNSAPDGPTTPLLLELTLLHQCYLIVAWGRR